MLPKADAQNGGIGAAAFVPNASSMFEIQSGAAGNKGFLPPRVTDVQRAAMNPLPAAAQGLIVYQTNTAGGSLEGLYYNTSLTTTPNWVYLSGGGWALSGNAGTTPGVAVGQNFLGTTDLQDFIIATNSLEAVRVLSNRFVKISTLSGVVDVGTGTALVTADATGLLGKYIANMPPTGTLELWFRPVAASYIQPMSNLNIRVYDTAPAQPYGIYYDGGTNTVGGYFRTTSAVAGTTAVQGFSDVAGQQQYGYLGYNGSITVGASTIGGASVYGFTDDPNSTAVYGRTQLNASVAAVLGYSNVWIPGYFYGDDASAAFATRPAVYGQLNTSISKAGYHSAVRGYSIYNGGGNPGYATGGNFTATGNGVPTTEDGQGVYGFYNGTGSTRRAGGYFYAQDGVFANFAAVAEELTNSKITGTGVMAEVISTPSHGRIRLTAPESPEYWYTDYGTVQLNNGRAHVNLDPILADIIMVDAQNPLKIFPQANIPNCNGLAVINKSATGFDLVEVNNGTSSGEVDYQIVAKPKTNYGEGRFAYMPGPMLKYEQDPPSAKAANQPDWNKIYRWPADWDVYGYNVEEKTAVGDVIIGGPNAGKIKLADGKYGIGLPAANNDLKTSH
ncbi:MAG: hypothetical protein NTV09_01050 [Bacteroidetes bacterium]|nr:hypothetical protein [Bacteroidota bacterium]